MCADVSHHSFTVEYENKNLSTKLIYYINQISGTNRINEAHFIDSSSMILLCITDCVEYRNKNPRLNHVEKELKEF